jgi:lysophospholipase L1-like esterase
MHLNKSNGRRTFLKKASLGGIIALSTSDLIAGVFEAEKVKKIKVEKGDVILFQGDSITDAHRERDEKDFNNASALGSGYAFMAASELLYKHPEKVLKIYNKGISGNKVYQLAERWEEDCLALKPEILSILIGVNDYWHNLVNNYKGTVKTYQEDFEKLLNRTKQQLPDVQLIIGEPFAIPGISAVDEKWFPDFNGYRNAAREVSEKFSAVFIPYQSIFEKAQKIAPGKYWTGDGVHPTVAGSRLMAESWLEALKG